MFKCSKIVLVVLIAIAICATAFAENALSDFVLGFNEYAEILGSATIDLSTAEISTTEKIEKVAKFSLEDITIFMFLKTRDKVSCVIVECRNESKTDDFMAYCYAGALQMFGNNNAMYSASAILNRFLLCRGGYSDTDTTSVIGNIGAMSIEHESGVYIATIALIDGDK